MKQRIKGLNRFQKGVLILLAVIVVLFTAVYIWEKGRSGYVYRDTILIRTEENGNTVYAGKIAGEDAVFTVTPDLKVSFRHGAKDYGVYEVTEDPSMIPAKLKGDPEAKGYIVRHDGKVIFEGCITWWNGQYRYYTKDGKETYGFGVVTYTTNGITKDQNGNTVDRMEPTVFNILQLADGPVLQHRGIFLGWFGGTVICLLTALSILFADELFRFTMAFRIRDAYNAEPSALEIMGRYGAWTILPIAAIVMYVLGLQV